MFASDSSAVPPFRRHSVWREKGIETVCGASKRAAKKRKVIDEDENDEWEDEDDEEQDMADGVHKKVRMD